MVGRLSLYGRPPDERLLTGPRLDAVLSCTRCDIRTQGFNEVTSRTSARLSVASSVLHSMTADSFSSGALVTGLGSWADD